MVNDRRRIFLMAALMVVSIILVTVSVLFIIYRIHIDTVKSELQATAQSQARLIEAVARFDREHNPHVPDPAKLTMEQIIDAHENYRGFGKTGEFTLARKVGNQIVFLFSHRHEGLDMPRPIPFDAPIAEPLRLALSGKSGTVIGTDYSGVTVIAAYEPVGELDMGIVAKIDLAEVREPYIKAVTIASGIVFLAISFSVIMFFKIGNPMVEKLERHVVALEKEIIERRRVELKLRERESLLNEVGNVAKIGGWEMDISTGEAKWTRGMYDIVEIEQGQPIPGLNEQVNYYLPEYRPIIEEGMRKLIEEDEPLEFEAYLKTAGGNIKWCRALGRSIRRGGECVKVYGTFQDISDHKRMKEALEKSESMLRNLMDNLPGIAYRCFNEPDWPMEFISYGCMELIGYDPEELLLGGKMKFGDVIHPEDRDEVWDAVQSAVGKGGPFQIEYRIITKDGVEKWCWEQGRVVSKDNSGPEILEGIIIDISDRKRAEQRSEHLNLVLQAIRNVNQLIVREKDRHELIEKACENLVENRGYGVAIIELVDGGGNVIEKAGAGHKIESVLKRLEKSGSDALLACARKALERDEMVLTGDTVTFCRDCALSPVNGNDAGMCMKLEHNGTMYGFLTVSIPAGLVDDEMEKSLFVEVAEDVAYALYGLQREEERKKTLETLAESEKKYRDLFDKASDPIFVHRVKGGIPDKIIDVNDPACKMLGYDRAELLEMTVADIISEIDPIKSEHLIGELEVRGKIIFESVLGGKNGEKTPVEIHAHLTEIDGEPAVLSVVRDIRERKAMEERLEKSSRLEAIGRLSGGVAHDFNNALTPILFICEMLKEKLSPDDPVRKEIEEIHEAGTRCVNLTRQLLAFGRRQAMQPHTVNLNEIVNETKKMLSRLIGEDIRLITRLAPDLGAVRADVGQLEQVIVNLAINARDAMPGGGELLIETMNVSLDDEYANEHVSVKPGEYVMLAFSDSGYGMDEETVKNVFEPFFTTKPKGMGTGLGLSTVYGIVKQSGGNIWVYSEEGKGTVFKIYLPRIKKKAEKLPVNKVARKTPRLGTETILLVEDEASVRKVAARILSMRGYTVIEASNGEEAVEKAMRHNGEIHLVLTDVIMPGMSGKEMSEILLKKRPHMKVVYVSGYTDNVIADRGILKPGTNFVQKPFTAESLAGKVREVLDRESNA